MNNRNELARKGIGDIRATISKAIDELEELKPLFSTRETSIAYTKMQEAEMWLERIAEMFKLEDELAKDLLEEG